VLFRRGCEPRTKVYTFSISGSFLHMSDFSHPHWLGYFYRRVGFNL